MQPNMPADRLVTMANQIATFFETAAPAAAAESVARHINEFWEPRMRAALLALPPDQAGRLRPAVRDALPLVRRPSSEAA